MLRDGGFWIRGGVFGVERWFRYGGGDFKQVVLVLGMITVVSRVF